MTPPEEQQQAEPKRSGAGYVPNLGPDPEVEKGNVFATLWGNLRDAFFPEKLPPLVLESKPVPVVDRMAVKRDPVSTGIAIVLHALVFLIIFIVGRKVIQTVTPQKTTTISMDVPPPVKMKQAAKSLQGGGGQRGAAPVSKGSPPPPSPNPIVPPSQPPKIQPQLAIPPAVNSVVNMNNPAMPNLGVANAPNVGVASMGNGKGSGLGSGNGNGVGPGSGGGTGGGPFQIGGDVSAPTLVYQPDPDYSEEARKAKFQGEVLVNLVVDAQGRPTRIKVLRHLGMGLDEKAVEAVAKYKFKPALKGGKPVPVELNVSVNFQIF
ncbi:MAG: energy transducer TonB [Acidobacteria bacterium]|nr:energy transducer TonB [Acidobacteriota bacterium]